MGSKMTETESRREAQDELIITALATGVSYEKAGEVARCSGRTVARRMEDAGFSRRVSKRRGERVVEAAGQLTSLSKDRDLTVLGTGPSVERFGPFVGTSKLGYLLTGIYQRAVHGSDHQR
jgi:hypothetical protein